MGCLNVTEGSFDDVVRHRETFVILRFAVDVVERNSLVPSFQNVEQQVGALGDARQMADLCHAALLHGQAEGSVASLDRAELVHLSGF